MYLPMQYELNSNPNILRYCLFYLNTLIKCRHLSTETFYIYAQEPKIKFKMLCNKMYPFTTKSYRHIFGMTCQRRSRKLCW